MSGVHHTILNKGVGLGNKKNPTTSAGAPVSSLPYIRQFVIPIPIVASGAVQTITTSTLQGWPTKFVGTIDAYINVITAESVGATKTLSVGYTGANTAFLNAQTVAAAGDFIGARPVVNIQSKDITYTLGSNDWTTAVIELVLTISARGD